MMMKWNTNPMFRTAEFVEVLNNAGIRAYADGYDVVFDADALKSKGGATLPHWIYMNKKRMLSPYHSEPV